LKVVGVFFAFSCAVNVVIQVADAEFWEKEE
jgi:hypothetical protein